MEKAPEKLQLLTVKPESMLSAEEGGIREK